MSSTTASAASICPIDGSQLARYTVFDDSEINRALHRATVAQREWSAMGFDARAAGLRALAASLRARREELAEMIVLEMGKVLGEARAEVDKSAWACEYYAEQGTSQLAIDDVPTEWERSFVQYPPLGIVLAIMPWNYPVWQVIRAAAPALMAGNSIVLKHASNVTGCALALADTLEHAGLPRPLLEVLVLKGARVAEVIADPRIAAVTLTGSEAVGVAVASACATHLKKSVLELGGSDPFVVLADADIPAAAQEAVKGRFLNAGQSCISAKRLIVVDDVAAEFEAAFAQAVRELRVGDPRQPDVDLGPMARVDLRDELSDQIRRGVDAGGRVLLGGEVPDRPGAWLAPTIVAAVDRKNPLAIEETFGPVAALLRAPDTAAAIALANASPYGLSASLWTADLELAAELSPTIQSGAVFVNTISASDPRMPFGGIKRSGWGRELGSYGIREFVNVQSVTIAPRRGA